MTRRTSIVFALFLLSGAACGGSPPTPAGTALLAAKFGPDQGGPPLDLASATPTRHVSKVAIARGAEIEVRLDVVEGPSGKYLHGVEVVVVENGGGTLTASIPAGMNPVNRGTAEQVVASLTLMTEWRQRRMMSSSLAQTSIEIAADGTAKVH